MGETALMRLLLDTHIWLWSLIDPAQMSPRIAKELADPDNEIWLSPISTWEALMLARKGLIDLGGDPESWLREAWIKTGPKEAALTNEIVLQSWSLQLTHADLADRFLAATAAVYDLTLVTADARFVRLVDSSVLPNR
jgi:PIN domain nuclease of toxin-antitoxin system